MSDLPVVPEARSERDAVNESPLPESDSGARQTEAWLGRARRLLAAHFAAYRRMGKWPFLWRITLEGLLVPIIPLAVAHELFSLRHRTDLDGPATWQLVVSLVVMAPFFETLLAQALPIMLVRRCGGGFWTQIAVSTVLFAAGHFSVGIESVIFAGLMSGFYITFTYAHWRQKSFSSALWMTCGTHAIHNLILTVLKILTDK